MARGPHGGNEERVPLAEARFGGAIGVFRMDKRQSPLPCSFMGLRDDNKPKDVKRE
jgi:hypothetical protein